jgi:PAS domain S-box-containing protein
MSNKTIRRSENEYRTIFETTGTATTLIEEDMTISRVNNEFEKLSGYSKKHIEGKKRFADFFDDESLERMKEYHRLRRLDPDAAPRNYECKLIDKKGNIKVLLATVSIIPGTKESVASFLDITERKQAEKTKSKLLKEIETIFENIPLGIAYLDNEFKFISTNKLFNDLTRCREEDLIGKTCYETVGEYAGDPLKKGLEKICSFCKKDECFRNVKPTTIERPLRDKFIRVTTVPELDEKGNIYRFIEIIEDITERKQAEKKAKLQQQQLLMGDKMKSLGILVSGIAHEINNPNNYILLNSKIISRAWNDIMPIIGTYYKEHGDFPLAGLPYSKASEKIEQLISGITEGSIRIQKIVQSLKDFARHDRGILDQAINVNSVIESALLIMENLIKKSTIRFTVNYGKSLPPVKGNFQQLEQVIINLVTNACQALTEKGQRIEISTSFTRKSDKVVVKVKDEGAGISGEDMKHIMDPFFTTKRDLDGTGLGLSISYNLVKDHGGDLKFVSKPRKGTTASVLLPVDHSTSPLERIEK